MRELEKKQKEEEETNGSLNHGQHSLLNHTSSSNSNHNNIHSGRCCYERWHASSDKLVSMQFQFKKIFVKWRDFRSCSWFHLRTDPANCRKRNVWNFWVNNELNIMEGGKKKSFQFSDSKTSGNEISIVEQFWMDKKGHVTVVLAELQIVSCS